MSPSSARENTIGYIDAVAVVASFHNHVKGWYAKMNRIAGKSHPNIFEVVELFKSEQATTEVTLQQLAAGGQPVVGRKQYQLKDARIKRIKEKHLAGDYSLDEYITCISKWMGFRRLII